MNGHKKLNSPRGEVGEIDTRAPFQSVKAAVSLFGEVAITRDRFSVKRRSSEVCIKYYISIFFLKKYILGLGDRINYSTVRYHHISMVPGQFPHDT